MEPRARAAKLPSDCPEEPSSHLSVLTFPGEALLPLDWCAATPPRSLGQQGPGMTLGGHGRELSLQEEALLKSELHLSHPFAPFLNWLYG